MHNVTTEMKQESRRLAGARVGIPPRQIQFNLPTDSPQYLLDNNLLATAFLAVLSGIFPPGERFFAESVRHFRDKVKDNTLKARVSGFMGQEALHGQQHERLNELFEMKGFNMQVPDRSIRLGLWLLGRLPAKQQLACTAFMEHFTARLGQELLTNESFRSKSEPELLKLWLWHALEELEHKDVAYDVYQLAGDSLRERKLAMPLVVMALLPSIVFSWLWLVATNRQALNLRAHGRGLTLILGKKGLVTPILSKMGVFWRQGFHPAKHDTRALVAEWQQRLFGENGLIGDEFRNREAVAPI